MLKYLFISEHADGSFIKQTQADRSKSDANRSQFYDVTHAPSPCIAFALSGEGHSFGVDLVTGEFSHNGCPTFRMHSASDLPLRDIELIFFRVRKHSVNVGGTVSANGTDLEDVTVTELPEGPVTYQIGFKGTKLDGSEFKRVMEFV